MVPYLKEKPSHYFYRQCYVSVDADEERLPEMSGWLGEDRLLYASDYPHPDAAFPGSVAELRGKTGLSERAKRKILGENAARFYALR